VLDFHQLPFSFLKIFFKKPISTIKFFKNLENHTMENYFSQTLSSFPPFYPTYQKLLFIFGIVIVAVAFKRIY